MLGCDGWNEGYVEPLMISDVDAILSEQDVGLAGVVISISVEGSIEILKEGVYVWANFDREIGFGAIKVLV